MAVLTGIIDNRYEIIRNLSPGNQFPAYFVLDTFRGGEVVLRSFDTPPAENLPKLSSELSRLRRLQHPNLASVHDLLYHDGLFYLVQAFAPGEKFLSWAANDRSPERICRGAAAILRALQYLHSCQVVLGSMTPADIRMGPGELGSLPSARIINFGKVISSNTREAKNALPYTAPEVLAGEVASPISDLYSWGIMLYEALVGRLPDFTPNYHGRTITIPSWLQNTVLAELLADLLHPLLSSRPNLSAIWESLELATGYSLQLNAAELKGPYWPRPPLIGRQDTYGQIEQVLDRVQTGQTVALQFKGYGKTTMAEETCFRGRLRGFRVIPHEMLGELIPAPLPSTFSSPQWELKITQMVDALVAQSRTQPILINLDGCSIQDLITARVVKHLMRLIEAHELRQCLLLWTHELNVEWPDHWEIIQLSHFDAPQIAELARSMLHLNSSPAWLEEIPEITGGDPRLVVNLIWAQIEAGLPETLQVPSNRAGLAEYRWALLNEVEQKLFYAIAHNPVPVPYRILRAVVPEAMGALSILCDKQLVRITNRGIAPANIFFQRTALNELSSQEKTNLHRRFSEVWQAEEFPDLLALGHHLIGAGKISEGVNLLLQTPAPPVEDLEKALTLLLPGDKVTIRVREYLAKLAQAQGHLDRALMIAADGESDSPITGALLKAEVLLNAGQPLRTLDELKIVVKPSMKSQLLRAQAYFLLGNYTEAIKVVTEGKDFSRIEPQIGIQIDHLAGLSLIYIGKPVEGLRQLELAEQAAREQKNYEILARILNSRGIALQQLSDFERASLAYSEALDLAQQISDWRLAAACTLNLGTLSHRQLALEAAFSHYRNSAAWAKRCGFETTVATSLSNEAELLIFCGALDQAQPLLHRAEQIARKNGAQAELGYIYLYQTEINLILGQWDVAERSLMSAREYFGATNQDGQFLASILGGELFFRKQDYVRAQETIEILLQQTSWDLPERWRANLLLGKILLAQGISQVDRAIRELELALALSRSIGARDRRWELHALLAEGYHLQGHSDEAIFHAGQFQMIMEELRRQVPIGYRTAFGQRPEINQACQKVNRIADPSLPSSPSILELRQLLEINKELTRCLAVDQLLQRILARALDLTGAERGLIILQEENDFRCIAQCNVETSALHHQLTSFSHDIARKVMEEGRPIWAMDAMDDARFCDQLNAQGLTIRAVLGVPLIIQGQLRGALYFDHPFKPQAFLPKHVQLLEAFADQAGIALDNARLFEEENAKQKALALAKLQVEGDKQQLEAQVVQKSEEIVAISVRLHSYEEELVRRFEEAKLIGRSKPMRELYLKINRIAETSFPVVIWGESGTGKELVAQAIHYTSSKKDHPFISTNCAAIPETLLESELFGHARGSFTGAYRDRPGLFEIAGQGTLFLDEIGDMPLALQSKLLRVLQEGTFRRIGDDQERQSFCRVLSASNKRLEELVAKKEFREDLYYRLNVLQIHVPPLRERREDILLLAEHLLAATKKPTLIEPEAMLALLTYDWPGNVRQLENELKRAAVLGDGVISPKMLTIPTVKLQSTKSQHGEGLEEAVRNFERQLIEAALIETNYKVSLAAQRLGVNRTALYRKMKQVGLSLSQMQDD